jgi:hypothetical protein
MLTSSPPGILVPAGGNLSQTMAGVTSYALAILTTQFPQLSGQGSWYTAFLQWLSTARANAAGWLQLAPGVVLYIPQALLNTVVLVDAAVANVQAILNASPPQESPSQQQQAAVQAQVAALTAALQQVAGTSPPTFTTVTGAAGALYGLLTDLQQDASALASAEQGAMAALNGSPQQPQAAALQSLGGSLAALAQANPAAQSGLVEIIEVWTILGNRLESCLNALQQVGGGGFAIFDMQQFQACWQTVATFAAALQGTPSPTSPPG